MSATLDPRTQTKIKAFAARRRELILLRGICALVAGLLVTMTALALLDCLVILPDRVRWALSVAGYGLVAVLVWRLGLRHLLGRPNSRELARLVERADPSLREDLISAIELGDARDLGKSYDSERFRELVQEDVGERASRIDVPKLLPLSMVSTWLKGALAAAVLVVVLALVPGLHFGKMFARALLPGVDLARPSDLVIEFIEPDPVDGIVPANEAVVVKVSITGGDVERAELEAREAGGPSERIRLTRERDNRFSGSLTVKREDVEYRVRSGGAITAFHTLESRGRPAISKFSKTYHEPSYTGVADYSVEEDHGDLSAIEGTMVDLVLHPDQEITEAELRLKGGRAEIGDLMIPLEFGEDGNLTARVPVTTDHSLYRVHLVAAESGFTNTHSPDYEIRAVSDLTPELVITEPGNNLEIRNDATLELKGIARDDISLKVVKQAYRLNRADWREIVLHTDCGAEQPIDHRWSLRGIGAEPGDLLVIKLIGVDSKGNVGESTPVRLAVTGWDEDPARREWAEKQKAVAGELREVAVQTREMAQEVENAKEALKKAPEERSLEEQQAVVRAQAEAEQAHAEAEQAFAAMREALAEAPSRAEAEELQAAAEMLADFKNQNLERVAEQVEEMATGELAEPADGNQRPQHLAWEAANRAEVLERALERIAAEDSAALAAEDLGHLEHRQEEIAQQAREMPPGSEAEAGLLKEEQEVAAARAESIEAQLRDLGEMLEGGEKNLAEAAAKKLDEQGQQLEAALAGEDFAEKLPGEAQQMEQRLEDVGRSAQQLEQQTAQLAEQAREELFRKQPPASKAIEEAKWQAEQVAREAEQLDRQRAEANGNQEQVAKSEAAMEDRSEQLADQLEALAEQFEDLADLEGASPAGDSRQAADRDLVARALDDLANRAADATSGEESKQVAEDLANLQEAIEAIDAGASAEDLAAALAEMESSEQRPQADGAEERADAWDVAAAQLQDLPQELGRVEDAQQAQQQAQQALDSNESRALENEMDQREQAAARNDENRQPQGMEENLSKLRAQIEGVAEKIEPAVEQARQELADIAPSVPEMLRELAGQVGEQQAASEALGEQAQSVEAGDASEPSDIAEGVEELLAQTEQAEERLQEAMDALRHEANSEDLLSEEGRESARDADDAAAQLAQAEAARIREQLEQAAASEQPGQQSQALEAAAEGQAQLAETLNQLADRLEGVDQGEAVAEAARDALRGIEQELGVEEALDAAFGEAEDLAEMLAAAAQDPPAALAALEQELQQNPAMQSALQELSENMVAAAAAQMAEAAQQEAKLGEQLSAVGDSPPAEQNQAAIDQASQQQESVNGEVSQAGESVERAARHEGRLGNEAAAESLGELGESAQALAKQGEAAQALEAMQQPGQQAPMAAQSAAAAESAIASQAQAMSAAAQQASAGQPPSGSPQQAQDAAGQQAPSSPPAGSSDLSPSEAAQAQMLAQALDSLDEMIAAQESGGQPASAAAQQAAQAQASAQQALQAAAQAQAQGMAQARASGQMASAAGQAQQAQSMAPSQPGQASPSQQGARLDATSVGTIALGAAANVDGAEVSENWSKLPSKVAKDIIEAQRQGISPEYRSAVESYYKALADRARAKQKQ